MNHKTSGSNMFYGLLLLAVFIGTLMPFQAGINAELSRTLNNPFLGAFISFATGTLALGVFLLVRGFPLAEIKRLPTVSPHLFLGGILGATFVGSSIFLIPRMGATFMIAAFVTGQLLMSVLMDHFGLLGIPVQPVGPVRIFGVILLFVGLLLVVRRPA